MPDDLDARAVIEDGAIVIRVRFENLPAIVEGAWAAGALEVRQEVTDVAAFAKALVEELNREDEQGNTPVHALFDRAIEAALEQGAEGIEDHGNQDP